MSETIEKNGRSPTLFWVFPLATLGGVIIGATVTFFINISTISTREISNESRIASLEVAIGSLRERDSDVKAELATLNAESEQLETQICAADDLRNMMFASALRVDAILWGKVGEGPFPQGDAYYPRVCNRSTNRAGSGK